jgi:hypothetical protein
MAEMSGIQDTLTIDPVAMNVVNRVAPGCRLSGELVYEGGVLLQGEMSGQIRIKGPLIVWGGGLIHGRIKVYGDLYLFGQFGLDEGRSLESQLKCNGTAFVSHSGVTTGTLLARRLQIYEGADLRGPFRMLRQRRDVPVLRDTLETEDSQPAV